MSAFIRRLMQTARRGLPVLLVAGIIGAGGTPAVSNTQARSDGNDSKGPLDLERVVLSHPKDHTYPETFRLTTYQPFTNTQIDGVHGYFEVLLDFDADERADQWIYVFYEDGKMRGYLTRPNGSVIYRLYATRLSGRSVLVKVAAFGTIVPSFDYAVGSVWFGSPCSNSKPCLDFVPNRYPLIRHDLTAPTITMPKPKTFTTDFTPDLPFSFSFQVTDDKFGSGVDHWLLQVRDAASGGWTKVQTGTGRHPTVPVPGAEGSTYDLRVQAWDKQHNHSTGPVRTTTVPYDDGNVAMTYTGSWTTSSDQAGNFLGTLHGGVGGDEMTFPIENAGLVCLLGSTPDDDASANVTFYDGGYNYSVDEYWNTQPGQALRCWHLGGETVVMKVHVTGLLRTFLIDGISVTHPG